MSRQDSLKIAQAMRSGIPMEGSPGPADSQGLEAPWFDPSMLLSGLVAPAMARSVTRAAPLMAKALPQAMSPELLPVMARGAKVGDPHALFAYHDSFGPGMTKRAIYNIFGDQSNPQIQKAGWGSSVPEEVLKKFGIPITGREPPR